MMAKKFKYIGNGVGVPGLPHEIDEDQAEERDQLDLLYAAIEAGQYAEDKPAKKAIKEGDK